MKLVHFYEVYQTTVRILCVWPTSLHTIAKGLAKDPLVFSSRTLATVTYCQVATTPCPKHDMQCFDSRGEESKLTVPWSPRASATLCTTVSGESSGSLGASTSTKFIPSQRLQARRSTPTPFSGVSISFASRQKTSHATGVVAKSALGLVSPGWAVQGLHAEPMPEGIQQDHSSNLKPLLKGIARMQAH